MDSNIKEIEIQIEKAKDFEAKYPHAPGRLIVHDTAVHIVASTKDAGEMGKIFGKQGWTRTINYAKKFDWKKEIDGVKLSIDSAENMELNESPVNPKDFPIQIEDAA